jgi:hypothetical protein
LRVTQSIQSTTIEKVIEISMRFSLRMIETLHNSVDVKRSIPEAFKTRPTTAKSLDRVKRTFPHDVSHNQHQFLIGSSILISLE